MARKQNKPKSAIVRSVSDCESPVVKKRLSRIEANYDLLEDMLGELEAKLPEEDALTASEVWPRNPR